MNVDKSRALLVFGAGLTHVSLCLAPGAQVSGPFSHQSPVVNRQSFRCLTLTITLVAVALLSLAAQAQPVSPHIGYIYPAGGRVGTTFRVTVGGQFLDGITNVYVSGSGVRASVAEYKKPLTQKQFNDLREKLKELQEKRIAAERQANQASRPRRKRFTQDSNPSEAGKSNTPELEAPEPKARNTNVTWTAADMKLAMEIRQKLATFQRRPASPAIAETATLEITFAPDAEPGERELRVGTALGLSNPLVFCAGQFPEVREKTPERSSLEPLARKAFRNNNNEPRNSRPTDMAVTIPTVINGQILPGEVDRYHFYASQGQQLVIAVSARELIPYLADAVPGWFQATLALYDSKGKELAYDDDYRFHPDPVLFYKIPQNGQYTLEIKDAIYRGREDFVYRITVGELPFITSIFPLGGPAGATNAIELKGWNLPTDKLICSGLESGIHPLTVRKGDLVSNRVPFSSDTLPECHETEPNDSPQAAQPVTLPVIINGRIDQPGDRDVFRFEGHAGDHVVAEVYARRLDSPLDSVLKLTDSEGRQLAFNDDHEDKGSGLDTHHADSYLAATLPANGTYYLHLIDAQHQGGPEFAYRLRISAPLPNFALRVVPSSISVRAGASVPITVYALRHDGFTNDIALSLKGAPPGFALSGAWVPAGQDQVRLTLTAPPMPRDEPITLAIQGRARIGSRSQAHTAVPAEDMMQAFAYRHLVPAKDLEVAIVGRGRPRAATRLPETGPIRIPAGGTVRVHIPLPVNTFFGSVQLELSDPPEGIALRQEKSADPGSELVFSTDAAKVKPGLKGNLIVNAFAANNQPAAKQKAAANRRRAPLGTLPAIPFEIVSP